jgi:hypothetical protein
MSEPSGSEVLPDPDAAEDFADGVGVDPTQDEIRHYQRLEGEATDEDETLAPEAMPSDPSVS